MTRSAYNKAMGVTKNTGHISHRKAANIAHMSPRPRDCTPAPTSGTSTADRVDGWLRRRTRTGWDAEWLSIGRLADMCTRDLGIPITKHAMSRVLRSRYSDVAVRSGKETTEYDWGRIHKSARQYRVWDFYDDP